MSPSAAPRTAPSPARPPPSAAALRVGPRDDAGEREAERAARAVGEGRDVASPALRASGGGAPGDPGGSSVTLRRHGAAGGPSPAVAPASVHEALATPGQPLDAGTRGDLEPRFGHSFAHVRVHADGRAAASARSVGALAYAVGPDLVFAPGRYAPATPDGRRLLAHELAHVVQHDAGASPLLRRFEGYEHQSLGDQATGSARLNVGGDAPDARFEPTHGDVVALSADYFTLDDLRSLGAVPGDQGGRAGSRDEIVFALSEIDEHRPGGRADPRFQPGGPWAGWTFSAAVRDAVTERYRRLAAANAAHFVAPHGRTRGGDPRPPPAGESNAGASYRELHVRALREAYEDGLASRDATRGRVAEAAAQHFLTDAFSSGHLRTPIAEMRAYWRERYPLFFYNLLHKLALDTAVHLANQTTGWGGLVPTGLIYSNIMGTVNGMAARLPEVGLGDLLARVYHDYDNERGLAVQGGGRIYGDFNLDNPAADNVTRTRAQAAIQAGNRDVDEAHALGRAGAALAGPALEQAVRSRTGATGAQFVPETLMPRLARREAEPDWRAPSLEVLWNRRIVRRGPTVGARVAAALQPGQEIRRQLDDLATNFPTDTDILDSTVHPRLAYQRGFLDPLVAQPYRGLLDIIHWAPTGVGWAQQDNLALDNATELDRDGRLGGMTPRARAEHVRAILDSFHDDADEEAVLRLFETTPRAQRRETYRILEGHAWNGDFQRGIVSLFDDTLLGLTPARQARLRRLLNERPARRRAAAATAPAR